MILQIPITITPRSKPSPLSPHDPFFADLKTAFINLITTLAPPTTHLTPPSPLNTTGCWCPDASQPSHTWKTCRRWVPQPIIHPCAVPQPCHHVNQDDISHLFCFNPLQAARAYVDWFICIPGAPESPLPDADAGYLGDWMREHYTYGAEEVPETEKQVKMHYDLLCRFFVEMRGPPPNANRFGAWYDAERVHCMLNWGEKSIRRCMDELLPALREAKVQRIFNSE